MPIEVKRQPLQLPPRSRPLPYKIGYKEQGECLASTLDLQSFTFNNRFNSFMHISSSNSSKIMRPAVMMAKP